MKIKITKIKKRDGRIVPFDQEKITTAIFKAAQAVGEENRKNAQKLSNKVVKILNKNWDGKKIPAVEEIQDTVEKVLIEEGQTKTAKAYILYRDQHARIRDLRTFINSDEIMEGYLNQTDWRVKENANMDYSLQGLNNHVASTISKHYWLHKIYPPEIREAYSKGEFHIHDLQLLAAYCTGWDLKDLLVRGFGGAPRKVESKPPKHLRTALGQAVNFFYTLQGETAGAVAFSNFDTYLAPFIRYDRLTYKETKQALQEFAFNMAVPTRVGFQSLSWDELVVIKHQGKIKFVEIGKLIDQEFEKNSHRIIDQNPQSFAVENYDDYYTLSFNPEGRTVWAKVKAFIRHRVPKNSKFIKIRTSRGGISVSQAHSLFSFSKIDKRFNPQPSSALKVQVCNPNKKITSKNHFIAVRSLPNLGARDSLDISEIIQEFSHLHRNIYVKFSSQKELDKMRQKILKEYRGFTPFYLEFNLKDKGVWQDWQSSLSLRYDIWQKFGQEEITGLRLRNSKVYFKKTLRGEKLTNFVKLCAWYISEGHADISNGLYLSQNRKGEILEVLTNLHSLGRIERNKGYSAIGNSTRRVYKIAGKGLLSHLASLSCGTYSVNKVIPWFIYELKAELQELFIKTLLKGDAAEFEKHWDYTTTSKKLSLGLSLLLSQNGYKFSVYEEEQRRRNKNWNDQYIIRIYKDKKAQEKYEVQDFTARICSRIDRFIYDKEYEYDISVDLETENFTGGSGLLVLHNTPFTNITLDLKPPEIIAHEPVIIGGKPQEETYGEFQKEMDMFNQAYAEVSLEGDAKGRVFTFPIPTYNITRDFDWNNPVLKPIWEMTAKYGIPYFSNFINSDMKPEDVRSMCCRLRLSNRELRKRGGGLFGANPLTGSIGVVTINMPRIGYLSKSKDEFLKRLGKLMDLAKKSLEIKREILEKFTEAGLYPYCRHYLSSIKARFREYWKNHFNTIGLNGMNEACLNLLGKDMGTGEGLKFALQVLDFMRGRLMDYQLETQNIYNLEATPAEGTSYRLAKLDKEMYPDIICANEEAYREKEAAPYYTNSSHLPVNYTDDIFEALDLQDELQCKYTGGTVLHGFLAEKLASGEAVKSLVKKIATNYHLPYYTLTPTFSICPKHGYITGEHFSCPTCGQEAEVYSRVVGYLRPVQQWNAGKQAEFKERTEYRVN